MATAYDLNKDFIEDVRAASNIVEVIGRHVQLRKRGRTHIGLCPFHNEKTPSFNVNPDRQMFYCFGCGAGGDVFKFLMLHESMSFPDAVIDLAKNAGLKIPVKSKSQAKLELKKTQLVEINEAANQWFMKNRDERITSYLKDRGLSDESIEKFQLGYALDQWDGLTKALKGKFKVEELESLGLIHKSSSSDSYIDKFRNRVMIPIYNASGRLIAFGGRIIDKGEPKYLNSPETQLFVKSHNLYGLYQGLRDLRKRGFAILVEGYFDAIMLHQAGFTNAVAPLGTSLTEDHARLLKRYCKKVIVCLDADEAGQKASIRSAGILLGQGFAVNVIKLPSGDDPDSYIQQNSPEAFKELMRESDSAYNFVLKNIASSVKSDRPAEKRSAMERLLPMINRIADPLERSSAIDETSRALEIESYLIQQELRNSKTQRNEANPVKALSGFNIPRVEKELLMAAMQDAKKTKKDVEELSVLDYVSQFTRRILGAICNQESESKDLSFQDLNALAKDEEEKRIIAELAVTEKSTNLASSWDCAVSIAIKGLKKKMSEIGNKISSMERAEPDSKSIDDLYERKMAISMQINNLNDSVKTRRESSA